MHLMLDVTNDLLGSDEDSGRIAWQIVGGLLHGNYSMHLDEFEYWSLKNSSIEDAFAITPYIRQMANETGI